MRKFLFGLLAVTVIMMTGCKKDEVKSITLNQTEIAILPTQTTQLSAVVDPADTQIVWTSDNTGVATVSVKGLVTAVSDGVANITAASKDGKKHAVCKVTVDGKVEGRVYVSRRLLQYVNIAVKQELPGCESKNYQVKMDECVPLTDAEKKDAAYAMPFTYTEEETTAALNDMVAFVMPANVTQPGEHKITRMEVTYNNVPFSAEDAEFDAFMCIGQTFRGETDIHMYSSFEGIVTADFEAFLRDRFKRPDPVYFEIY